MRYLKSSQPVPGKGLAWTFYECNDNNRVLRYVTYHPSTLKVECVPNPLVKELYHPEMLGPSSAEEFERYWAQGETPEAQPGVSTECSGGLRLFSADMTIGEALTVHPRVREVLAAFHLGGCSHCSINEFETLGQVCAGYGVDIDTLLEVLESLIEAGPAPQAEAVS